MDIRTHLVRRIMFEHSSSQVEQTYQCIILFIAMSSLIVLSVQYVLADVFGKAV